MIVAKKSAYITACCVALISGALGVLAYSPFDYWIMAFVSAAGLIWLGAYLPKKIALLATFLWGVSYFAVGVNWVQVSMTQFGGVPDIVSYAAVLLLAAYLALYPLLFSYLAQRFAIKNPWVLASLLSLTEYLRGVVFTGFPWLQFGYSLIDSPFYGVAPLFGVEGLSFWVWLTSGYFVKIFCNRPLVSSQFLPLGGVLLLSAASQWLPMVQTNPHHTLNISLVQGNIEQKMKWDPAYFNATIRQYEQLLAPIIGKSDVIIFPESAIPALEGELTPLFLQLDRLAQQQKSEIIIGTLNQASDGMYNSAVVLGSPQHPYQADTVLRYNKHHLVPFGEYVPFGNLLDWLREVFILPVNLAQGELLQTPLLAKQQRFNTAICYEIIFGDQVRQNQRQSHADYLLTISNDAWFGTSIGPWQHFQMARMRALELGKPLIRATNTGITAFIDPFGKVLAQAAQFEATTLTYAITTTSGTTLFTYVGHWLILGLSGIILLLALVRKVSRT